MVIETFVIKDDEIKFKMTRHNGGFKLYVPFFFIAINDVTPEDKEVWVSGYDYLSRETVKHLESLKS